MQRRITLNLLLIVFWFDRSAGKRSARSNTSAVSSAPLSRQHTATFRSENSNNQQFNRIPCPIALRQRILGLDQPSCRCSRHYIPQIMDIEYDEFIQMEAPDTQIIVIAVISSLWVFLFVFTTSSIQILYGYSNFNLNFKLLVCRQHISEFVQQQQKANILKGIELISVILFSIKKTFRMQKSYLRNIFICLLNIWMLSLKTFHSISHKLLINMHK